MVTLKIFITLVIARTELMQIIDLSSIEQGRNHNTVPRKALYSINAVILNKENLARVHLATSGERHFSVVTSGEMGGGAPEIQQVKAKDAVQHLTTHKMAPFRELSGPKCQQYLLEKPYNNGS